MNFADFWYRFIDEMLCDCTERPKTLQALRSFAERVPEQDLAAVAVTVFAPANWKFGCCMAMPPAIIYLAPKLEDLPQAHVDHTVAHEFAHAALGHHLPQEVRSHNEDLPPDYRDLPWEQAADALAASWGFPRPEE